MERVGTCICARLGEEGSDVGNEFRAWTGAARKEALGRSGTGVVSGVCLARNALAG
jgi:hypothetical protein